MARCSVCNQRTGYIDTGGFHGRFRSGEPLQPFCPWCIANGKAAEKYDGYFNYFSFLALEESELPAHIKKIPEDQLDELVFRTPRYSSLQGTEWFIHCHSPCIFLGKTKWVAIRNNPDIFNDINNDGVWFNGRKSEEELDAGWLEYWLTNEERVGYLFKCFHCGKYLLNVEYT